MSTAMMCVRFGGRGGWVEVRVVVVVVGLGLGLGLGLWFEMELIVGNKAEEKMNETVL